MMVALLGLLGCKAPQPLHTDLPAPTTAETGSPPYREWVEISTAPCARDSEGYVECWSDPVWEDINVTWTLDGGDLRMRELTNEQPVWGVRLDNDLPYYYTPIPEDTRAPGVTGYHHIMPQCALNGTDVVCWQTGPSEFPSGEVYVNLHGEGFSHAALTDQNQLYIRFQGDPEAGYDFTLDPARVVVDMVHVEPADACVLDSDGIVECFGTSGYHFDNPPYVMLAATYSAACAVREDWRIDCRNGSTFDFGPLREIEVTLRPSYVLVNEGTASERWQVQYPDATTPPHICVITRDNAIRCEGFRYDFPTIQASLPQGDG
ncbi:MAG: hypothetical protein R3F61_25200 [Myxococcota bacterium]